MIPHLHQAGICAKLPGWYTRDNAGNSLNQIYFVCVYVYVNWEGGLRHCEFEFECDLKYILKTDNASSGCILNWQVCVRNSTELLTLHVPCTKLDLFF